MLLRKVDEKDEEFDGGEFTSIERRKVRKIIRDQERMDWLWATLRIWTIWAVAVVGTLMAAKSYLVRIIRAVFTNDG